MNLPLILGLIALRYKLLWAKTRSRNGRIALFLSGYLLLLLLFMLMALGGFGAAIGAVRTGKALLVAQAVLGGLFVQSVISTNIMGFGLNNVFSELELRRYPLSERDRAIARHLIGILDPFWFLFFFMEVGLALGLYGLEAAGFWQPLLGVLLFFLCNYLCARFVGGVIDQLMKRKGGATILLCFVMGLAILPGPVATLMKRNSALGEAILSKLAFTPPFAAGRAMLGDWPTALNGWIVLLLWTAAFLAALVWMEKRPPQRQAAVDTKVSWDSPLDRVAAIYPPSIAPFVGHWLRFYLRNQRIRTMTLLSLPLSAFLTYSTSRTLGPDGIFIAALGTVTMVTFLGTSRLVANQFGYSGGGFRRYFLLPAPPSEILRAASYASLTLGAVTIPVALLMWVVIAPGPHDPRRLVMLIGSALTALFLFNAAGLWVTLFNPRKGNYDSNFGNDLSLGGNVLLIGSMLCALLLPRLLRRFYPAAVSPDSWLFLMPLPLLAAAVYRFSLNAAGPVFSTRRERLLAVVEGKDN